jgi:hypothetical protein
MKQEAVLTPTEIEICKRALEDPNIFTDYFFKPYGERHGWLFDANFDPQGAWQRTMHSALQKDITVIGGFGTGKTMGVAMSACTWATLTSDFKFLNVGPQAWQAQQMYDMILLTARNTRFEALIWEKPRKPHPKLVIRYRIGASIYESSLEFLSADKDATGILSWEGDWLHIDEAGLMDNLEEVIINVGSRLRGTVRGRERLGRFSMTSNSWDNFYLWYYFDQASSDPENFLSIVVSSRHNHNVTDGQLQRMLARIPEDERQRFIDGTRPEGKGTFFDKKSIYECEIPYEIEMAVQKQAEGVNGYKVERIHGAGVTYYITPAKNKRVYMLFGDPGTGGAPTRNAPVLMVWDVTDFPVLPARLVTFYWGNGGGKIGPFINQLMNLISIYNPVYTGIDSTGPQKNMAYLINEYALKKHFEEDGMPSGIINGIAGLDFSGPKKISYLHAARLLIESKLLSWPKDIIGIRSQLSNYDFENDKKIAQDIVATVGMSAHAIRTWFHVSPEEIYNKINSKDGQLPGEIERLPESERTRRSSTARIQDYRAR